MLGYMSFVFLLSRRETHLRKQKVLQMKDRKIRACQAGVEMWPVESGVQDGQWEVCWKLHMRVKLFFFLS